MERMKKYLSVLLIVFVAMTLVTTTALAEDNIKLNNFQEMSLITPRLTYIDSAEADLTINNGIATVDCWVDGDIFTATKAKVIAELQVKSGNNWIAYGTWTDTQYDYTATVYETKSVKSGNTYRVKATFTVWEGSQSESIVVFTDEVTA